jgi:hypothetical protein
MKSVRSEKITVCSGINAQANLKKILGRSRRHHGSSFVALPRSHERPDLYPLVKKAGPTDSAAPAAAPESN